MPQTGFTPICVFLQNPGILTIFLPKTGLTSNFSKSRDWPKLYQVAIYLNLRDFYAPNVFYANFRFFAKSGNFDDFFAKNGIDKQF